MRALRRASFGALGLGLAISGLTLVPAAPAAPAAAVPPTLPAPSAHGITLQSLSEVGGDERMLDATVTSGAIFTPGTNPTINPATKPVIVRILLPEGYGTEPGPWPVLYLLHGGAGDHEDWSKTDKGDVEALVDASDFEGIVVMPEGGKSGWYSDWAGTTDGRFRPRWETFHVDQLVPWIDANFDTIDNRSGRSIVGISMGGYGALRYAGRHSDVFSGLGVLSGGTDIRQAEAQSIVNDSMWFYGASFFWTGLFDGNYRVTGDTHFRMETVFGDDTTWSSVNPQDMAAAYDAYDGEMWLYSGDTGTDEGIGIWNDAFHEELGVHDVDHRYCTGAGDHSWGYWRADFVDFLDQRYGDASPSASCPNGWGTPVP